MILNYKKLKPNINIITSIVILNRIKLSNLFLLIFQFPFLKRKYGMRLSGNYQTYEEAKNNSIGYDNPLILKKVLNATINVLVGNYPYERDGTNFKRRPKKLKIREILKSINKDKLNIVDFGGSLGSNYLNNLDLFHKNTSYTIIEQENFVNEGLKIKARFNLPINFLSNINELNSKTDILILSSVINYIPNLEDIIKSINSIRPKLIIIDRTAFTFKKTENWMIQHEPTYYSVPISYPLRPLNIDNLLNKLKKYRPVKTWVNRFDAKYPIHRGILLKDKFNNIF